MAKTQRGSSRRPSPATDDPADTEAVAGTGGFLGQIGLFETANGLPHGPIAIMVAIVAAILIYPVSRLVRAIRGR